jgi:TolB-like protein
MFTDIVGYNSLLKEDENKAFETRKKNQRIHKRLIKKFNGRWLKDMESSTLASFSSIIDAVMCALSIQKAAKELNIPIRCGIHQGEVLFEKNDVLGDGVNIASRIQGLADSYDTVISERVYDDIKNKEGLDVQLLGEHTLKGVTKPTVIYKVSSSDENLLDFTIDTGELVRPLSFGRSTLVAGIMIIAILAFALYYFLPKIINPPSEKDQSVLVLPCVNYTGTDTLDYFLAGMHDAMIGDIGKISALRIISTTTAKTYKNTEKSIPEIASELGVNNIIEPSVMCLGDSVCIRLKAISAYPEEKQLWVHDFKVEKSEILSLYNMVTKDIADKINVALTPQEEKLMAESRAINKEVYDDYMKAQYYLEKQSRGSLDTALYYLNRAIEKEPDWAPLYAGLADVWIVKQQHGFEPPSIASPKIYENLNKAFELDPDHPDAYNSNGLVAHVMEWDWEKSERAYLKALAINPNDAGSRILYAQLLCVMKRTDEALMQGRLARELDPLNPGTKIFYAAVLSWAGDNKTALALAEEVLANDPESYLAHAGIQVFAYPCEEYEKLIIAEKYFLRMYNVKEEDIQEIDRIFKEHGLIKAYEKIMKHLEEVSENYPISPVDMAMRYIYGNQEEKAVDWLEKGFELHDPVMTYIAVMKSFAPLFDNPRFLDIVEKMNLPLL